jgi:anti-anti-sigma regulatory factor
MKIDSGTAIYTLDGELDSATAGEVRTMLADSREAPSVLLELTQVKTIDKDGMEVLRDVIYHVHGKGGRVAISRPWRLARSILGLVGTEGLVFLALSPAGALAWLDRSPPSRYPALSVGAD